LLPLATVARKSRNLTSGNCADVPKTDLCHHPFEARARLRSGRRAAQILVDHFDLVPAQPMQTILHRILQLLALQIVADLVGRRLAHVQHGLARQMLCPNLVTHRAPPARVRRRTARDGVAAAVAPANAPPPTVPPAAGARRLAGGIFDRQPRDAGSDRQLDALCDGGRINAESVFEVGVHREVGRRGHLAQVSRVT